MARRMRLWDMAGSYRPYEPDQVMLLPAAPQDGYRSEDNLKRAPIEVVVALGREGKQHAEIDARQSPHTAAMAAKLRTEEGRAA